MTADVITGHWVELAVTCAPEAVEVVAALFSEYRLNEGVVIEEAFTQETDGDVEVDPSRPVKVSTYLDADDSEGVVDDMREAIARIGVEHDVSGLLVRSMVVPKCEHEDWADAWQARWRSPPQYDIRPDRIRTCHASATCGRRSTGTVWSTNAGPRIGNAPLMHLCGTFAPNQPDCNTGRRDRTRSAQSLARRHDRDNAGVARGSL